MATTFESLIEKTYSCLGVSSDSVNYPLTVVKECINKLVARVVNGVVYSLIERDQSNNPKKFEAGELPFRKKNQLYIPITPVRLTADITTASVTIPFDTSSFPTTGAIMIQGEIITYTGKTSAQITGTSAPQIAHNEGDRVYPLYTLPASISKPYTLFWIDASGSLQEIPPQDSRQTPRYGNYFSIVTDNNGNNYLFVNYSNNTLDIQRNLYLVYYALAVDMVDNDDECIIPETYTDFIPSLVAWQLAHDQEETAQAQWLILKGERGLNEMYQYYNNQTKKNKDKILIKPANFNTITWYWYGQKWRNSYR